MFKSLLSDYQFKKIQIAQLKLKRVVLDTDTLSDVVAMLLGATETVATDLGTLGATFGPRAHLNQWVLRGCNVGYHFPALGTILSFLFALSQEKWDSCFINCQIKLKF